MSVIKAVIFDMDGVIIDSYQRMNITLFDINNEKIAVVDADNYLISSAQEALELLMNCNYNYDTAKIILREEHFSSDFFDLKTKLAGEILQKFSTYNGYLAIVGDFTKYTSSSLKDFIKESNRFKRINFVASREEAFRVLTTSF